MKNKLHTNSLINENSPYLLQHAHNPVDWLPWGEDALDRARKDDKLLLISIGYSACHWCHVMERESFEDEQVAEIMNKHFVCIKVDREERPDIDQVYMSAVQLMTGQGGWPLNCIALPDSRPIYGGTYFRKEQWMNVLTQLAHFYSNEKDKAYEYAENLTEGIKQLDIVRGNESENIFSKEILGQSVEKWSNTFDHVEGGTLRAPKFPLPDNYLFLLRYGYLSGRKELTDYVELTLNKIAYGGIYDQLGGGFARYSTDTKWKVPHFEKMLYDNAQLVSLYSEAYQLTKNNLYKKIVYETCGFIKQEMTSGEGAFFSAYDADSEGEEGKYYVWKMEELKEILNENFELFAAYYNINEKGFWEHGNYILLRDKEDAMIAKQFGISEEQLNEKISTLKKKLLNIRNKRIKPGLDDKSLTSWNALMLKGFADAYAVFNDEAFLQMALNNASFILGKQLRSDGGLNHTYKKGKSAINAYLEDYAFTIEAFLALYRVTFDEKWLQHSKQLLEYAILHFYDKHSGMFWFTSDLDPALIARRMEIADNVIPASNSIMAYNLFILGTLFDEENYLVMSKRMLGNVSNEIISYGPGYSHWAALMLNYIFPFYEIAIAGERVAEKRSEILNRYIPNSLLLGLDKESKLPLLQGKYLNGKTMIHVCYNKTCKLPVEEADAAIAVIKNEPEGLL